jgi:hypothetical protein
MTTATLRLSAPLAEGASKAVPATGKSFLARFYDALIEARMRQAMRELAMHRHLVPTDIVKEAGYAATVSKDATLPFTR